MQTRTLILILGFLLHPWTAPSALAQVAQVPGFSGALEAAGSAPADADLVVVIENATHLSRTALGVAFGDLLDAGGPLAESRVAWQALALRLGWPEEAALDLLLGGRVVLIARGIDNPLTARWVLLSHVSKETDRRLKEKLQAAPRKIDKGHQILVIEQGRYELTSHFRSADRHVPPPEGRDVTLLLAPTGRSELLDSMLGILSGKPANPGAGALIPVLKSARVLEEARRLGSPELLLLARLGNRDAPAADGPWPDFLVLSARRAGADSREWVGNVVIRDRARQQERLIAEASSSAAFDALSRASLLTIVQMAPLATIFGRSLPFDDPLSKLPWPSAAADLFTGKQMIRVHKPAPAPAIPPGEAVGTGGDAGAGLICTLAMETNDSARLAAAIDGPIGRFFAEVELAAGQRDGRTPPVPDFAGIAPEANRILDIELGTTGPLSGVTGPGLIAAWAFPSTGFAPSGWWTLAMSTRPAGGGGGGGGPVHASQALAEAAAGLRQQGGEESRWVWLMAARPSELEKMLAPGVPDYRGLRTLMRRITDAGCRLSITDRGDIQGELRLLLADPKGP